MIAATFLGGLFLHAANVDLQGVNRQVRPQPVRTSLTCNMVEPSGRLATLSVALNEAAPASIRVSFAILGHPDTVASEVISVSSEDWGDSTVVRRYQVPAPEGRLSLRVINHRGEWGAELAPVEWSSASGPLLTGRCRQRLLGSGSLSPVTDDTSQPEPTYGLIVNEPLAQWPGAVSKHCRILGPNGSVDEATLEVSDSGAFSYAVGGATYRGQITLPILKMSEDGHSILHERMQLRGDAGEVRLSFLYRQGRFWVDGDRSDRGRTPTWFRGVCVEQLAA